MEAKRGYGRDTENTKLFTQLRAPCQQPEAACWPRLVSGIGQMSGFKHQHTATCASRGERRPHQFVPLLRPHPSPRGDEGGLSLRFYEQTMAVPSQSTETTLTFATIPLLLPGTQSWQSNPAQSRRNRPVQSLEWSTAQHNTRVWTQHFTAVSSQQQGFQKHFRCPHREACEEVAVPVHQQRQNPAKTAAKVPAA